MGVRKHPAEVQLRPLKHFIRGNQPLCLIAWCWSHLVFQVFFESLYFIWYITSCLILIRRVEVRLNIICHYSCRSRCAKGLTLHKQLWCLLKNMQCFLTPTFWLVSIMKMWQILFFTTFFNVLMIFFVLLHAVYIHMDVYFLWNAK